MSLWWGACVIVCGTAVALPQKPAPKADQKPDAAAQAQAAAKQNEGRAIKAYQKLKGDEKLKDRTRKALQIALALLDDGTVDVDSESEKESLG